MSDDSLPGGSDARARHRYRFASRLGGGLTLLIVGNALLTLGAFSSLAGLAVVGGMVSFAGLILTVVAVTAQAAAIEGIAAALGVARTQGRAQAPDDEFFGRR